MKTLKVQTYSYSVGYKAIEINELGLKPKPIGEGAFGEVYECISIDNKTIPQSLAVKIFFNQNPNKAPETYRTILQLQQRMSDYESNSSNKRLNQIESLSTLPRITFQGILNGKKVYGYITKFLAAPNWIGFNRLFDEENLEKRKKLKELFYRKSFNDKVSLAIQLIEGFQALRTMSFIHADLNPHNLFINLKTNNLAIIDFDSGAITNQGSSEAETFGKLGDWLAPEIRNQLIKSGQGRVKVNLYTDSWAVAVGIHAMFFWAHPLFYLKSQGKIDMKEYFYQYDYPSIDSNHNNFRIEYLDVYKKYNTFLNTLPHELLSAFKMSFNGGFYTPSKRLSYSQWLRVLEKAPNKQIEAKKPNPTFNKIKNRTFKIPALNTPKLTSFSTKLTLNRSNTISRKTKEFSSAIKTGTKNIWLQIFKPPEIKELKRKVNILEKSERKLEKKVIELTKQVEVLESERNKLGSTTQNLEKKNTRLIDSQQNLLAERNNLRRDSQSQKREIELLGRKIFYLESKKWLGENSKKAILLLLLALLLSWLIFLFNLN